MRMLLAILLAIAFPALAHAQAPSGCPLGQMAFLDSDGKAICDTPLHHYGIYCPEGWTPPPGVRCSHRYAVEPPPSAGPEINGPHMLYAYADMTITNQNGKALLKPGSTDVGYVAPLCIVWKNTFLNGIVDLDVKGYPTLVSRVSFYADTRDRMLTILRVEIPNLMVANDGKLVPNPNGPPRFWRDNLNIRIRLYDQPVRNPSCSPETWAKVGGMPIYYRKGTMEVVHCGDPGSGTYWGTDGVCHGGVTAGTDPDPYRRCYTRNGQRIVGCDPDRP